MPSVPDASSLILLGKLEQVNLLSRLYGQVIITPWVWEEAITVGKAMGASDAGYLERAAEHFARVRLSNNENMMMQELKRDASIGAGEAEILAVAANRGALAILDDRDARIVAVRLSIPHTGTVGVLYEAFLKKLLSYNELVELLGKLATIAWIAPDLLAGIIRRAGEVESKWREQKEGN
jgi:predicted nucleic acid-binding protein